MAKLGNLNAPILINACTMSGQVEVGHFEIPLIVTTEMCAVHRLGVKVELPENVVKAALQQWASEMAEALA
jgi:hypothetical protein